MPLGFSLPYWSQFYKLAVGGPDSRWDRHNNSDTNLGFLFTSQQSSSPKEGNAWIRQWSRERKVSSGVRLEEPSLSSSNHKRKPCACTQLHHWLPCMRPCKTAQRLATTYPQARVFWPTSQKSIETHEFMKILWSLSLRDSSLPTRT